MDDMEDAAATAAATAKRVSRYSRRPLSFQPGRAFHLIEPRCYVAPDFGSIDRGQLELSRRFKETYECRQ